MKRSRLSVYPEILVIALAACLSGLAFIYATVGVLKATYAASMPPNWVVVVAAFFMVYGLVLIAIGFSLPIYAVLARRYR